MRRQVPLLEATVAALIVRGRFLRAIDSCSLDSVQELSAQFRPGILSGDPGQL